MLFTRQLEEPTMANDADARAPLLGSELGRLGLTMADLRRAGHPSYNGWDEVGKLLLCNHNVEMLSRAIVQANQDADLGDALKSPMHADILTARDVIMEVFTDPKRRNEKHIGKWAGQLNLFAEAHALSEDGV